MKKHRKITKSFNAFLRHTGNRCPVIAYCAPIVPAVECIVKHELASGIGYYGGHDGKEIGAWFSGTSKRVCRQNAGIKAEYRRFPEWDEIKPPGNCFGGENAANYVHSFPKESAAIIRNRGLFLYAFLYYDRPDRILELRKVFGDRFIPGLVMEADHHIFPAVAEAMEAEPHPDRSRAYRAARSHIAEVFKSEYPYGLSGSGIKWFQGAAITKQKRWDHEIANGNFQIQLSFLRGVSSQHNIPFVVYVAPMGKTRDGLWGTKVDPDTPFSGVLKCTYFSGGKPDHLLEREWYAAWFSGASAVVLEGASFYLFRRGKDDSTFDPGMMAPAAKKLNHLAWTSGFDRGRPYRPACILLDERHGWDLPTALDTHEDNPPWHTSKLNARKIWGVFEYEHKDIMIDNFLGAVYPGYELAGQKGHPRGDLVQTPYGDSFDVLMSNASNKALAAYPVAFLLGCPSMTKTFRTRLERYVTGGGKLVVNVRQVVAGWKEFLGVDFEPRNNRWYAELGVLRPSDWSEWIDPSIVWREQRYNYTRVGVRDAEVLAVTEQGDPLVIRGKRGKGYVYLVTAHYMQEASGLHRPNGILEVGRFLLRSLLDQHLKVKVCGPALHCTVNERPDGLAVLVMNNRGDVWDGWLRFRDMAGCKVDEWYSGERLHAYSAGRDLSVRLELGGYQIRLITVTSRSRAAFSERQPRRTSSESPHPSARKRS